MHQTTIAQIVLTFTAFGLSASITIIFHMVYMGLKLPEELHANFIRKVFLRAFVAGCIGALITYLIF